MLRLIIPTIGGYSSRVQPPLQVILQWLSLYLPIYQSRQRISNLSGMLYGKGDMDTHLVTTLPLLYLFIYLHPVWKLARPTRKDQWQEFLAWILQVVGSSRWRSTFSATQNVPTCVKVGGEIGLSLAENGQVLMTKIRTSVAMSKWLHVRAEIMLKQPFYMCIQNTKQNPEYTVFVYVGKQTNEQTNRQADRRTEN